VNQGISRAKTSAKPSPHYFFLHVRLLHTDPSCYRKRPAKRARGRSPCSRTTSTARHSVSWLAIVNATELRSLRRLGTQGLDHAEHATPRMAWSLDVPGLAGSRRRMYIKPVTSPHRSTHRASRRSAPNSATSPTQHESATSSLVQRQQRTGRSGCCLLESAVQSTSAHVFECLRSEFLLLEVPTSTRDDHAFNNHSNFHADFIGNNHIVSRKWHDSTGSTLTVF
jgi:hypothetical protein